MRKALVIRLKTYFKSVLALTKSGERFPVDLDSVWPLCYVQKVKAVQFLTDSGQFYEGEDYILLSQKVKQTEVGSGGHNRQVYMLSVPCMEYLIARKVRAVFEVYRRVFHEVLNGKQLSKEEMRLQVFIDLLSEVNHKSEAIRKQWRRIKDLTRQLESEKAARAEKRLLAANRQIESVDMWLKETGHKGLVKLSVLFADYSSFCHVHGCNVLSYKVFSRALCVKGFSRKHRGSGTWFDVP